MKNWTKSLIHLTLHDLTTRVTIQVSRKHCAQKLELRHISATDVNIPT